MLNLKERNTDSSKWSGYWTIVCHTVWNWCNKEEHDELFMRPYDPGPYTSQILKDYDEANSMNTSVTDRVKTINRWTPPSRNMVKLNTDSVCKENNVVGCKGIIREEIRHNYKV